MPQPCRVQMGPRARSTGPASTQMCVLNVSKLPLKFSYDPKEDQEVPGILENGGSKIIEWFGLDETLKITQFHSHHGQEHIGLDQVVQSSNQPGLEGSRDGSAIRRATASLANFCHGLITFTVQNFLLKCNLNLFSFSLK
ncbi:hypothetical protein TURU_013230 [Turdus rufiventris]|nr:hypothetical protein TURU_013230 [Turdus rufiventris]